MHYVTCLNNHMREKCGSVIFTQEQNQHDGLDINSAKLTTNQCRYAY